MGSFPGFITRTSHVPQWNVTVSVMTNAIDGLANQWTDGILGIMAAFSRHGAPQPAVSGWNGRWWTIWAPIDLVPIGNKVLVADPASLMPFASASEIEVSSATAGTIVIADGIKGYGESVTRTLEAGGATQGLQLGGNRYVAEVALQKEIEEREAAAHPA
jgi:D-alanyl-D-alanine carboxypeptidase